MTKRSTSVSTEDDWILHVIVIISILITEFVSCFTPRHKQSQKALATSPSQTTNVLSSSKQTSRSIPKELSSETPRPTRRTARSTATSTASSSSTGFQPTTTKISKAGTKSRATKTLKSGRSTASASHQETTRLNQTILIAGCDYSDSSDANRITLP